MLFDLPHILYMVISSIVTIGLMILCFFVVKNQKYKDIILKISAVLTIALHFSSLYVNFFKNGQANVEEPMLFPIYPCNVAMWFLAICAFYKNKQSKVFGYIAEFTFYLGIVGGIVGIAFNEIYANAPNLALWSTLKGLLSHSTMIFGCVYLLVGKYIKIRVKNTLSVTCGLLFLLIDGSVIIGLYKIFKLDPPNCMYLLENPFPKIPWFNTYLIGMLGILITFLTTVIVEQIALPKEERWYSKIKEFINRRKQINE